MAEGKKKNISNSTSHSTLAMLQYSLEVLWDFVHVNMTLFSIVGSDEEFLSSIHVEVVDVQVENLARGVHFNPLDLRSLHSFIIFK